MELNSILKGMKDNKKYQIEELERFFSISEENRFEFYDILFELEKSGKIFTDELDLLSKVPSDFCYQCGVLKLSNQNQYYINVGKGNRISIDYKDLMDAKVGDTVYVEKKITQSLKHKKLVKGRVVHVVTLRKPKQSQDFFCKGVLKKYSKSNRYYVELENRQIVVLANDLNGAFPKDEVTLKILKSKDEYRAQVIDIIKRNQENHVFVYQHGRWVPIETEPFPVELNESSFWAEGTKIVAKIGEKNPNGIYELDLIQVIPSTTMNDDLKALAIENGFSIEFPKKALEEASKILPNILLTQNRRDLRNLLTFTIDPKTAKDLDDAVSLEIIGSLYRLYVHIADVDYYVNFHTELFQEAIKRGCSAYPGNIVIPQFPSKLSDELCSLNSNGDKMTKTIMMDFNEEGQVVNFDIFHSIIRSSMKMDYDSVNKVLNGMEIYEYESYKQTLYKMKELSGILTKKRIERGSIIIDSNELKCEYNLSGEPVNIIEKQRGFAEIMIENFMLKANETASQYAYWLDLPFIFRNHPNPSPLDAIKLNQFLKQDAKIKQKIRNIENPAYLQKYIRNLCSSKTEEEAKCFAEFFLKAFPRAYYGAKNEGHYALALDCYGTMSSPIRKASDLINHYVIGSLLNGNKNAYEIEEIREILPQLCSHFTERQQLADQLEQKANRIVLNNFFLTQQESEISVEIVCFMKEKIYVKTKEGILGVIPLNKSFKWDSVVNVLIDSFGQVYRLGDKIVIENNFEVQNNVLYFRNNNTTNATLKLKK